MKINPLHIHLHQSKESGAGSRAAHRNMDSPLWDADIHAAGVMSKQQPKRGVQRILGLCGVMLAFKPFKIV